MPRGKYPRPKKLGNVAVKGKRMESSVELASAHAVIDGLEQQNERLKEENRQLRLIHIRDVSDIVRIMERGILGECVVPVDLPSRN